MVASAMESKRLGLCQKSIFVVPNHLTEQWASEFLRLYPSANILVTTKKDFETHNRKKFCARIATGDYDAVIIGHSQFERIPISPERQERLLHQQIEEITDGIQDTKLAGGNSFTIKSLERTKKGLEARLKKLQASDRKDDVIYFEQLGVDRMFVDESDNYKNLFLYGTRKEMGLRPFSLSKLKPANQYQAHTAKQMEFQNFCFAYKKREPESLHIPSAELPVGETIAIIGLNGAGKSTLARCICGLEKKCGLLQVDGKTLDWKARLKHCYMVMQDTSHQLFTESVTDEVLLSIDNEDETVVDKILKQFDLLEYKDRHPLSLSGGQKQRVAIASAIVSNREIIVFDEPTSGLDLKHMREVARSLKSLADQGKTLLVITHDPELVMAGCSYVVHMEKGQIKESYPLDESGSKKVLDFFRIRQ